MKRVLAVVLAVVMLITILPPIEANAADIVASGTCGANLTWTLDSNGLLEISGTGTMSNYFDSRAPWYSQRSSIKTVKINSGVTSIGDLAFWYCSSLTSAMISDSVTIIGRQAFYECTSLTSVTIPDRVTSIGSYAFNL